MSNEKRMTSVEIQAWSVEEAIRLALEQLELSEDQVEIEVLSEAGPNDEEALVRVTARGHASQPTPSAAGGRAPVGGNGQPQRLASNRRAPGDRPSQRQATPRPANPTPHVRAAAEDEEAVKQIVTGLLERMGVRAEVVATDNPSSVPLDDTDPPTIFIDVLGRDLGMLIGRRGEHLAQLQYMVNLLSNKKIGNWTRVIVDVEGYRARREEALIGLADRVARQVARSRRPIVLEPMPPNERRIVHLVLRDNPDVSTESSGEGAMRRITVQPRA
jgi:spoIIIJ-associated protein